MRLNKLTISTCSLIALAATAHTQTQYSTTLLHYDSNTLSGGANSGHHFGPISPPVVPGVVTGFSINLTAQVSGTLTLVNTFPNTVSFRSKRWWKGMSDYYGGALFYGYLDLGNSPYLAPGEMHQSVFSDTVTASWSYSFIDEYTPDGWHLNNTILPQFSRWTPKDLAEVEICPWIGSPCQLFSGLGGTGHVGGPTVDSLTITGEVIWEWEPIAPATLSVCNGDGDHFIGVTGNWIEGVRVLSVDSLSNFGILFLGEPNITTTTPYCIGVGQRIHASVSNLRFSFPIPDTLHAGQTFIVQGAYREYVGGQPTIRFTNAVLATPL